MSDSPGEVSEVDIMEEGGTPDLGDVAPDAEYANQVAGGEPRNYGDVAKDENLVDADEAERPSSDV